MILRGAGWLSLITCAVVTATVILGASSPNQVIGYAHRVPDHFDLFLEDFSLGVVFNLTRTPLVDEPEWDWSPDGQRIVYTQTEPGQAIICILERRRMCLPRQSAWDHAPQWSPDGNKVAFLTHEGDLFLYFRQSGVLTKFAVVGIGVSGFNWSPDSRQIAYVGSLRETFQTNIYLLDIATGERQQLTHDIPNLDTPQWSPDGQKLLFSTSSGAGRPLMILDLVSGELHRFQNVNDHIDRLWMPDGQRILYLQLDSDGTSWMIYDLVSKTVSMWRRHLTLQDSRPIWSPDGAQMAMISTQRQWSIITVMEAKDDADGIDARWLNVSRREYRDLGWHP